MVTKKEFLTHMEELYGNECCEELYKSFKSFIKIKDKGQIRELREMTKMTPRQRLAYRHALASNGKEYTPSQIDQYISMIEFALEHIDHN